MRNRVSIMSLCGCQHTCGSQGEAGEWLERGSQVLVWGEMHIRGISLAKAAMGP